MHHISFDSESSSACDKKGLSLGATLPDWKPEHSTCEIMPGVAEKVPFMMNPDEYLEGLSILIGSSHETKIHAIDW